MSFRRSQRYDICCLQNVLEHVIDPRALIGQIRRLLKPGGVAVITVPNDFSRIQMKAKAQGLISRQFWVAPPQHLHYFNTSTLAPFLTAMGFAIRSMPSPISRSSSSCITQASNYIENSSAGKQAHKARVELDLLLAENGIAPLLWPLPGNDQVRHRPQRDRHRPPLKERVAVKVLVAGARGFLGSAACSKLIGAGHDVVGVSRTAHDGHGDRGSEDSGFCHFAAERDTGRTSS